MQDILDSIFGVAMFILTMLLTIAIDTLILHLAWNYVGVPLFHLPFASLLQLAFVVMAYHQFIKRLTK